MQEGLSLIFLRVKKADVFMKEKGLIIIILTCYWMIYGRFQAWSMAVSRFLDNDSSSPLEIRPRRPDVMKEIDYRASTIEMRHLYTCTTLFELACNSSPSSIICCIFLQLGSLYWSSTLQTKDSSSQQEQRGTRYFGKKHCIAEMASLL